MLLVPILLAGAGMALSAKLLGGKEESEQALALSAPPTKPSRPVKDAASSEGFGITGTGVVPPKQNVLQKIVGNIVTTQRNNYDPGNILAGKTKELAGAAAAAGIEALAETGSIAGAASTAGSALAAAVPVAVPLAVAGIIAGIILEHPEAINPFSNKIDPAFDATTAEGQIEARRSAVLIKQSLADTGGASKFSLKAGGRLTDTSLI
jgi:hypothetical protein